jgi:sugar O-acyltransferase (sialic acid O-acetyltransferase NeuD family)
MKKIPRIIIGAGGHAKVLISVLRLAGEDILGVVEKDPKKHGTDLMGVPILGDDDVLSRYPCTDVALVNGVGGIHASGARRSLFERFKQKGYSFSQVIHPDATIAEDVRLEEGVQIMAGTVLQPGTTIGLNTLINTQATVDHDCFVGSHVHVAPGATLSGHVRVNDDAHIGTGAIIIQSLHIGKKSTVGAGAVVTQDVPDSTTVTGIPAKAAHS